MKKFLLLIGLLAVINLSFAQPGSWQIVGGRITSPWADSVNPANVLPDYPRPQMKRNEWKNLNGLWQYAVLPNAEATNMPSAFQGNILVPFAVESALSGVGKTVGKDSILWYKKTITVGAAKNKNTLLHFGAVDWK